MSNQPPSRPAQSTSDRLPHKPTRESAAAAERRDELSGQRPEPSGMPAPEHLGAHRRDVGDRAGSAKRPPHVTPNEEDAPVQDDTPATQAVPVLPANASGTDAATTEEQAESIDPESMYDRRPERDKDQPPSERD